MGSEMLWRKLMRILRVKRYSRSGDEKLYGGLSRVQVAPPSLVEKSLSPLPATCAHPVVVDVNCRPVTVPGSVPTVCAPARRPSPR